MTGPWNVLRGLRARILAALVLFGLAVSAYFYLVWLPGMERAQRAVLNASTQDVMASASRALTPYLLQGQLAAVYEVLDGIARDQPDWVTVQLLAADGRRLYPLDEPAPASGDALQRFEWQLSMRDQKLAMLIVEADQGPALRELRASLSRLVLTLAVGVVALAGVLAFLLDRSVRRPIAELSSAAESLAAGNFETQLPEVAVAEVADLVGSFDQMRADLAAREDELRLARDEAEQSSEAKTKFLATMSHEMRTPLSAVLGMSELLQEGELSAEQTGYLASIRAGGEALMALINDILDLSKIEAGQLELSEQPFHLGDLVDAVAQVFASTTASRGLELLVEVPAALRREVRGDQDRIRQILLNLIGNAFKFTQRGHVALAVSQTSADDEVLMVCFSVCDTGIGIPAEQHEAIFASFAQLDASNTRQHSGTGLGLDICQSLAALMNGRVWLEQSAPGEGSVFKLELPLAIEAQGPEATASNAPVGAQRRIPARVLVAEDTRDNRVLAGRYLERAGHEVVLVENGEEAVVATASRDFDVVLMDVEMPVMDGISATREIRSREREAGLAPTPILALTAHAVSDIRRRCLDAGMNEFLTKPIRSDILVRAVAQQVEGALPALLVVDDSEDFARLVVRFIDRSGTYRACWANGGAQALALLRAAEFACVLSDVGLPDMSGLELIAAIRREHGAALPVIVLSGHADEATRAACLDAGCVAYQTKPVSRMVLLELIEKHAGIGLTVAPA